MKILPICFLLLSAAVVTAQSDGKAVMSGGSSTTLSASEKEDVGDIHPVSDKPTILSHLRGTVQARGEFVTNAKLLGNHGSSDYITFPTAEIGYNTPLGHGFSLDLLARSESAIYAGHDERSFWGFSGNAFLDWRYRPNAPRLFVGTEPYFYNSFENEHRLAEAFVLSTGIDDGWVFNQHRTLFTAGYKFSNFYASPGLDDRDAHRVILGLTHQFRPGFYGQLFYQFQYSNYINEHRRDSRNIVGLNFIYQFNAHLYGSVGADFIDNDSNQRLATYQNFAAHAGLALQF